jgi:hypothetical protein
VHPVPFRLRDLDYSCGFGRRDDQLGPRRGRHDSAGRDDLSQRTRARGFHLDDDRRLGLRLLGLVLVTGGGESQ